MKIEGLKNIEDISPRFISEKRAPFYFKKIKPDQKQEYERDDWEMLPSKLKKSIKVKKQKPHNIAFEDRIWALFAKMGFEYLNEDQKFRIEYQPGLKKQIDVIAADKEAILIVECKSAEIQRKTSYQKDINELIGIKEKLRAGITRIFSGKAKVAFIFGTNNSILSDNDKKRLEEEKIFHFDQDEFDYYEQITDHLGSAAKYQLFGKLFKGQKIPELKNRVPAIKGKMASGHTFYSFSIEPEFLLKIGFILHRTETNKETALAYQRLVKKPRLKKIAKYIEDGGYFPNSIIINIVTKEDKELNFDEAKKIPHDSYTKFGVLHLPQIYRGAFIIDGQHRLYGYSKTKSKSHHTIPVVAFHNLPEEEQAHIFIDINQTQKSIPANLLASIMADFNWGSPSDRAALSALKTKLFIKMNSQDHNPFYKRIILAEEKQTDKRCLTLKTILDWGLNKTNFFGKLKDDKLIKTGYLTDITYDKTLEKSLSFFTPCIEQIQNELKEQWDRGKTEGGFVAMNIGVTAILRTIDCILEFLVKQKNLTPENMGGEALAESVIPYLEPVIAFTRNLDHESIKRFLTSGHLSF